MVSQGANWWLYLMLAAGGLALADGVRGLASGRMAHEGDAIDRATQPVYFWLILAFETSCGAGLMAVAVWALVF